MHGQLRSSSTTSSRLVLLDIDAIEQIFESALVELDDDSTLAFSRLGDAKISEIEPFVKKAKPGAVEKENLDGCFAFAEEDEERAAACVPPDAFGDDAGQTVEAPPQIDGLEPDEHLDASGNQDRSPTPAA